MTKSQLIEAEAELFKEWSSLYENFSPDGIVDVDAYCSSQPLVMLIMKETNSKNRSSVDLKDFLFNGGRHSGEPDGKPRRPTWDNVIRWVYGMQEKHRNISWSELSRDHIDERRNELLKSICVMNVKKTSGGHTSVPSELHGAALTDKKLLQEQFELYFNDPAFRPNVIIGCGSDACNAFHSALNLKGFSEWGQTKKGVWYAKYEGGVYISYSHPAARVSDNLLHYGIVDAYRELTA